MSGMYRISSLYQLAQLYGIQTSYYDVSHRRRPATGESLLTALQSLGAPLNTFEDVPHALRERQISLWKRPLEPVIVAWEGVASLRLRLPLTLEEESIDGHILLESGEGRSWRWVGAELPTIETTEVEGDQFIVKILQLPQALPWGYHSLTLDIAGIIAECFIISAPIKAYGFQDQESRTWGVFLPLYALYSHQSWGGGSFSDLENLLDWVIKKGGGVAATLPMLATFLEYNQFDPSPYSPVSRLLWNEFYLDINQIPELKSCATAQAMLSSDHFRKEIQDLQQSNLVDYCRQMALKRRVLEELSHNLSTDEQRLSSFHEFVDTHPVAEDYAAFRAAMEKTCTPWQTWAESPRKGTLRGEDYEEEIRYYHLYVQWLAHEQMKHISAKFQSKGPGLYLDFPLGVHPEGYDVWRYQDIFLLSASCGAPPDAVFTKGQDWSASPLHPEKLRNSHYNYYIQCVRHHLKYAGVLRIDHAMGLHRLFVIPQSIDATDGVYLRYPAEEFYAILCLESHRNKAVIIGEDLGTVPHYVRPAMARHGFYSMYVVQYEIDTPPKGILGPIRSNVIASLNTHDMPPFSNYWQGLDISDRHELGLLDQTNTEREMERREVTKKAVIKQLKQSGYLKGKEKDVKEVLQGLLYLLSASSTPLFLINLEDLWLENNPQNVPGTKHERPNWQRKALYPFEVFRDMPEVIEVLENIQRQRQKVVTLNQRRDRNQ
ncbi:MAG: 4-alpha-glucanotransferase [Chloroflexota bacterium]|nr:4-alpha-glucanotransferase [Chloroflexota bacterium]